MHPGTPDAGHTSPSASGAEVAFLRERVRAADLPDEVLAAAELELSRLERLPVSSPEHASSRGFFDWLLALPWSRRSEDRLDVSSARRMLDEGHFGLDHVKEQITHHLAAMRMRGDGQAPVLCLVGPNGSGKTSLCHSIARILGRELVRVSLRGVTDEAEVNGRRRTVPDAQPGRIIRGIRQAGRRNPVFVLEEIDRMGESQRGNVTAALLEALEPRTRRRFVDQYLDLPFDLSEVLFVTTANLFEHIHQSLEGCLEPMYLPGYVPEEKARIMREYLLPREMQKSGLTDEQLQMDDDALRQFVSLPPYEAGVSHLKTRLGEVTRKAAFQIASGRSSVHITVDQLGEWSGTIPEEDTEEPSPEVGLARALVITPDGASVSKVEVTRVPGPGQLTLTGPQSEERRELVQTAVTILRAAAKRYDIDPAKLNAMHLHVHFHDEVAPSDLGSVGLPIVAALVSSFTGKPIRADVGLTGGLSLRGRLRAVPATVSKVFAARRRNLSHVVVPADCAGALDRVPGYIRDAVHVHPVKTVEEALELALLQIIVPKPEDTSAIELFQGDLPPGATDAQNAGGS